MIRIASGTSGSAPFYVTSAGAISLRPLLTLTCEWCGQSFDTYKHGQRFCERRCKAKAIKNRRKSRECGTPEWQTWTLSQFMVIARRFDYRCAYCGEKPDRLDPDHVIPLSRGGRNTAANLLPSCLACNSDKRDLSLTEWAQDRQRRDLSPRHTTWGPADSRYVHLTSVLTAA